MILGRLTTLRKSKNWSLQETADQLGIAKSTYAGYESGYRRPSLEAIKFMADLFGTSIDYLLGRVDHPNFPFEDDKKGSVIQLELTELSTFKLAVDGTLLSQEEAQQFVAFIRAKREIEEKSRQHL
jgi:transcriptional regulator with XRE-family HTH domain